MDIVDIDVRQTRWMSLGACTGDDAELFFPGQGQSARKAVRICGKCPVREECEAFARETESVGVFGGILFRENGTERTFPELTLVKG